VIGLTAQNPAGFLLDNPISLQKYYKNID